MGSLDDIKILHIANTDFFFYHLLLNKLTALRKQGAIVHLVSPPGKYKRQLEKRGFRVSYFPISREINPIRDVISIINLIRFIKEEGFHIVHTHTGKGGFVGRVSSWIAGVPIIMHTIHGFSFYDHQNFIQYHLAKLSERFCGLLSYRILFQSKEDFNEVKKTKMINPLKVRYLGNGLNINHILEETRRGKSRDYRKELHLDDKEKIIGFFARLETIKRHEFFLQTFPDIVKKVPDTACLIVGEGHLENKLRSKAKELMIDDHIRFLGFREDAKQLMSICDLVVLPSYREGIPRTLMEAMLNEKPVVATDVRGNREVVDNYRNGILVDVKDSDSFSRVIIDLLKDGIMMEKMGRAGKKKVIDQFDENRVIKRLIREYVRAKEDKLDKK